MIVVNLDVMLAKRKMRVTELSERIGITMANISILKNGKAKAIKYDTLEKSAVYLIANQETCWNGEMMVNKAEIRFQIEYFPLLKIPCADGYKMLQYC